MQRPTNPLHRVVARPLAVVAAALAIGLSGAVLAQPHGPAMHGGGQGMVAAALQAVKSQLNLNTSQQTQWDAAVADAKNARQAARTAMQQVHDALKAELAKPEPDFAAVAALEDQAGQTIRTQRIAVRNEWLSLYSTFTPEQKAVVRDAISQRLAKMDQFRARMQNFHGRGPGG